MRMSRTVLGGALGETPEVYSLYGGGFAENPDLVVGDVAMGCRALEVSGGTGASLARSPGLAVRVCFESIRRSSASACCFNPSVDKLALRRHSVI